MSRFAVGASAIREHTVRRQDCATHWSNDLPVLATPVLLWLGEVTAMQVIEEALDPAEMTVGCAHTNAEHLAATPQDWVVTVTATLTKADERMLEFAIAANDGDDLVYRGTHVRAVVDRERFLRRLARKAAGRPKEPESKETKPKETETRR
jgi:fluoroacetyl-CoA thioesterase